MSTNDVHIKNKKARFEYELLDKFDAGIQLSGTEIKSIRNNKASIVEAFCTFMDGELYVRNMHIAEYEKGGHYNHNPKRDRKLLLHKKEIQKLQKKLKDQGLTIVPLLVYVNDRGWAKMKIALAKGKKLHDKRDDLKEKDAKRAMERAMKR